MEFKVKTNGQRNGFIQNSYLVSDSLPERFVGRLCQTIEMLGLPHKQEEAVKDAIRRELYAGFSRDMGALFIDSDLSSAIYYLYEKEQRYATEKGLPGGFTGDYELKKTIPEPEKEITEE
jgi:hypothetical protein